MLIFDCDDANLDHIPRHNVTREEAEQALSNDPVDLGMQYDEQDGIRYQQIGETNAGRILVFVATWRDLAGRIFTAWDAPKGSNSFILSRKRGNHGTGEIEDSKIRKRSRGSKLVVRAPGLHA
jgi:uncharacterized DUF497 family protein